MKGARKLYIFKEPGLKVQILDASGSSRLDKEMFDELNFNHKLKSDDIKIYPTIVTKTSDKDTNEVYTEIQKWYNEGKYIPYSDEELNRVIMNGRYYESTKLVDYLEIFLWEIFVVVQMFLTEVRVIHQKMEEEGMHCSILEIMK